MSSFIGLTIYNCSVQIPCSCLYAIAVVCMGRNHFLKIPVNIIKASYIYRYGTLSVSAMVICGLELNVHYLNVLGCWHDSDVKF